MVIEQNIKDWNRNGPKCKHGTKNQPYCLFYGFEFNSKNSELLIEDVPEINKNIYSFSGRINRIDY